MALPSPSSDTTALVTGASSGIGLEIARQLAARGHGLTLVARRLDRLEQLAAELRQAHDVQVEALSVDLAVDQARAGLFEAVSRAGRAVDILVNCAGIGLYGPFINNDPDREATQLAVLVGAVLALDRHYLPEMVSRGRGAVINVASLAGFQPLPGNSSYAASKAFVLRHSEALHVETKPAGVTVTAVCPGPVRTEFLDINKPLFVERVPAPAWVSVERVATDALDGADAGRRVVVPGNRLTRALFTPNRLLPASLTLPVSRWLMAKELTGPPT